MTNYAIMTPELDSYYLSPESYRQVSEYYDSIEQYVIKEGSTLHRAVLVRMKRKRTGTTVELNTGHPFRWIPRMEWRYETSFRWLNFSIRADGRYRDAPDLIVKDHYSEAVQAGRVAGLTIERKKQEG